MFMEEMIKLVLSLLAAVFMLQLRLFIPPTWYKPRIGGINEFVQSHGYPIENHQVQTEDGYILTVHRIPSGKGQLLSDGSKNNPPVFLMHGLMCSSLGWVVFGPEKSIAFMLADAGYDVWLGNNRGNTYSRNHVSLDPNKDEATFFNYSYHEIGMYDLPAMIDYVLNKTGHQKITYIGYSQGATSFLVMGALQPEYNEKILLMNAYAPVTNMYNITSVPLNFIASNSEILEPVARLIGWHKILDHTAGSVLRLMCQINPICNVFFRSFGMSQEQQPDKESLLALLSSVPAGASLKQIVHFVQGTRTGIFGPHNPELTDAVDTKEVSYDLTKVTAPIILYYGEDDNLINTEDLVNSVAKKLPNVVKIYRIPYPNFNHLDFLWGKDIRLLNEETLRNINMYNNKTTQV